MDKIIINYLKEHQYQTGDNSKEFKFECDNYMLPNSERKLFFEIRNYVWVKINPHTKITWTDEKPIKLITVPPRTHFLLVEGFPIIGDDEILKHINQTFKVELTNSSLTFLMSKAFDCVCEICEKDEAELITIFEKQKEGKMEQEKLTQEQWEIATKLVSSVGDLLSEISFENILKDNSQFEWAYLNHDDGSSSISLNLKVEYLDKKS